MSAIEYDVNEPNSRGIALTIVITTLLLILILGSTTVYYLSSITKAQQAKCDTKYGIDRMMYESQQSESLTSHKVVDVKSGMMQVPISVAIDHVVKDYQ